VSKLLYSVAITTFETTYLFLLRTSFLIRLVIKKKKILLLKLYKTPLVQVKMFG